MKIFTKYLIIALTTVLVGWTAIAIIGCAALTGKTAYQTIAATEAAVVSANGAYLDAVVSGIAKTNGVPTVEAAFNDTQLALHTAASLASGGASAPVPPAVLAKATSFTNTINSFK